ncbi:MAG: peptidase domain-containing ABC transporter [Erysipelotrichaceae bacterium]|nr:peptidase domain-containing ABC transporter [Erysipelotrichaceae bacterium]
MRKKCIVLQDGFKECGSACLLSIIRYYGGNVSMERILELTKTGKDGTNFHNMSLAGLELGMMSKGYFIDNINDLDNIEKPFISQIVINNYHHFVVVYKINGEKITIMDPAKGMENISISEFLKIFTGYILIMEPIKKLPIYNDNNYLLNTIKEIIISNKKIIINLILLTLITTIFMCLYSYHFKIIIDKVIDTNKLNLLIVVIIFAFVEVIKLVSEFLRNNLLLYLEQKIDLSIITNTINKIISLPYSYYKNRTTGEIITRVNDLFYVKNAISKIIVNIFLDIFLVISAFIILFSINKTMTVYLIFVVIIYLILFRVFRNSIKQMTNKIQEDSATVNSSLVETISGYDTVKGLNLENAFKNKINKQYLNMINDNLIMSRINNYQEFLRDLFEGIIVLLVMYLGATYIMDKSLTIGSLITYNSIIYYFLNPIRNTVDFYKELFYVKNSIKRINNILNLKYESQMKKTGLVVNGKIEFRNLSFSYNGVRNIIDNFSLKIDDKSKVLILGDSGVGKSTLLKLVYKYYETPRGMVYINDKDIQDFELGDIRSNITYVSQNEILYTDTIKNNIILYRDISEEEYLKVSRLVYVEDIILKNKLSYDYMLEENGANISGGQRQRIILARALLKKGKVILIDEGLNEIDPKLEKKILKNIFREYKDRTFIIISHRKDNIEMYDKVINVSGNEGKEVAHE